MSLSILHNKLSPPSDIKLRCRTCLSLGRDLKILKHDQQFLLAMLCPEMFSSAKANAHFLICWECEFTIIRIQQFQARLMKAHLGITLALQGVKTIVEGLSSLIATEAETINIIPPAPQIIPTEQNHQLLIEISQPKSTRPVPLKLEPPTIKIEVEEEEKSGEEISRDYDDLRQPSKMQQASSDESTDTASETDMYDDPLMTDKKRKKTVKCANMATNIPFQNPIKATMIAPNVSFSDRPQKVFVKPLKNLTHRGVPKAVKHEGNVRIAVKDERRPPLVVKSKGRISVVVRGKGRGRSISNRLKDKGNIRTLSKREELMLKRPTGSNYSNLRSQQPPEPQPKVTASELTGFYGYDEYEVKCIILNRIELNAYRNKQRVKAGYKGQGFNCDKCIEKFMNQKNLDEHNKKHDKARGNSVCELCEQRFPNDSERDEHYKQHFIIFECLKCPYQINDRLKISEHIRRIHEVSDFDCKKCAAVFKTYKEKRKHIVNVHSNRERQKCAECPKTFRTWSLLKTHMATHERETTECTVCQKRIRKNYLDKHMKIHEDTGEDTAYCVDCKKIFRTQRSYNLHLKTSLKHNPVEKVGIKCDHCNKYFARQTSLRNHLEEVNGVKYTCDICKKDSKNKELLARHIRFVHKGEKPQPKPKICEYCGKSFTIKKSLEQHINKHLGCRPLVCKDCGATFIYSAALYTHRRLVHKVKKKCEMSS